MLLLFESNVLNLFKRESKYVQFRRSETIIAYPTVYFFHRVIYARLDMPDKGFDITVSNKGCLF
jgi:hypothetical protein